MRTVTTSSLAMVIALVASVAPAQSPRRLWVLQAPDQIVEYDASTFAPRRAVRVPRRVLEHPEFLSVNGKGQMIFAPPPGLQWAGGEMATAGDRVWLWDGQRAREWRREPSRTRSGSADRPTLTERQSQVFLSGDGERLVWFENTFEKVAEASGLERSVRGAGRVWRTDLSGGNPETVTRLGASGWCRCGTGTCSESCPEWQFWAPDGVVGDFFLLTRVTPGQTGSTTHESVLYRRAGSTWRATKLAQPAERPLTASANGALLVAAVPDAGCCGWENESNDRTLLWEKSKVTVLFDELERYANRNYDVSFYTAAARFAPGDKRLAYTIVSTARTDTEIRLASEGKDNPDELARIRKAIGELPVVEIVTPAVRPRSTTLIHRAALVGWLNEDELLVAAQGRLSVYDIRGARRRETPIRVRSAADALLR
jgi:hypothetical protein